MAEVGNWLFFYFTIARLFVYFIEVVLESPFVKSVAI